MSKTFEEKVREILDEMEGFVTNDDMFEVGIISLIRLFDVEIAQAKLEVVEELEKIIDYQLQLDEHGYEKAVRAVSRGLSELKSTLEEKK